MYPYNLLSKNISSILGENFKGEPWYLDLSINNQKIFDDGIGNNQAKLNDYIFDYLRDNNIDWAVSGYLENRASMLYKYEQMAKTKRFYHLGVDIILPLAANLYMPLDGVIKDAFYEEGEGNYGGCVVVEHNVDECIFYVLYGHLNKGNLPKVGANYKKGEAFACIGDFFENGNWFYHTHLQVLTKEAYDSGWVNKGYCCESEIATMDKLCPNPLFLLRAVS